MKLIEKRVAAVVTMGQTCPETNDIDLALAGIEVRKYGILDGFTFEQVKEELWPKEGEPFIVSNLADGTNVRITEKQTVARTNACLARAEAEGAEGALILCTGHFEPPETNMTLLVPERVLLSMLGALGVKRLGVIVPEPEQIEMTLDYYADFNPVARAASPYGSLEQIEETARLFKDEPVDLILSDCMGFTKQLGAVIASASNKRVFVPRVVLPALLGAMLL